MGKCQSILTADRIHCVSLWNKSRKLISPGGRNFRGATKHNEAAEGGLQDHPCRKRITMGGTGAIPGGLFIHRILDFSAPKLWQSARRKVFHNSTGKDERFLRMTGNPGHGNGSSFYIHG